MRWLDNLRQDLHFSLRITARNPGFTLAATLTLALGIGAATATFSVVNAVVIRPLRYPEPDRLMAVHSKSLSDDRFFGSAPGVFFDWRTRVSRVRKSGPLSSASRTEFLTEAEWRERNVRICSVHCITRAEGSPVLAGPRYYWASTRTPSLRVFVALASRGVIFS
jgi:hypothetical protein